MIVLPQESQLRLYSVIHALQERVGAFGGLLGVLKQTCARGDDGLMADLVPQATELQWQLDQLVADVGRLQSGLGVTNGKLGDAGAGNADQGPSGDASLRGGFGVIAVPDLFHMLGTLGKTGTLELVSGTRKFWFEFQGGSVVHAASNRTEPTTRLGTILVARNKLTPSKLELSLRRCAKVRELLGSHLVRTATVAAVDLRSALAEQVFRTFGRAFSLTGAGFEFFEGRLSELQLRATVNTTELLLEVAKRRDGEVSGGAGLFG